MFSCPGSDSSPAPDHFQPEFDFLLVPRQRLAVSPPRACAGGHRAIRVWTPNLHHFAEMPEGLRGLFWKFFVTGLPHEDARSQPQGVVSVPRGTGFEIQRGIGARQRTSAPRWSRHRWRRYERSDIIEFTAKRVRRAAEGEYFVAGESELTRRRCAGAVACSPAGRGTLPRPSSSRKRLLAMHFKFALFVIVDAE